MKVEIFLENLNKNFFINEEDNLFSLLNNLNNIDEIVGAKINNNLIVDFYYKPKEGDKIKFLKIDDEDSLTILNHSTSHIMAYAVKKLYPEVKLAIGPSIKNGFYYDFYINKTFTPEDLVEIENKMKEILKNNLKFEKFEINKDEARELFKEEKFKLELIDDIEGDIVSIYKVGEFFDLCRGPHLKDTTLIKNFKILSSSSSYWRGDEKKEVLQRIYGTSFFDENSLNSYLEKLKEVEKRDHRRLGKELDLFSIHPEEAGPGFIFFHPKGGMIRKIIEDFEREEHLKRGYQFVYTPHIAKAKLWEISGHLSYYKDNMYSQIEVDNVPYLVKPMNCPGHILIYKSRTRSYKELPLRFFELGTVYRYERSGVLHGLLRVRGFTQDDAHIFCTEDQLEDEIIGVLNFALFMMKTFGFENYEIYLSTRPEKFVGAIELWEKATNALIKALEIEKIDYKIDPGEGVFYGPKIDIKLKDSLDRLWQGPTIQVDFNLPQRFNLTYMGNDGKEHTPVMIHRVVLGSIERFFGALIENYAGNFPLWLSPVQIKILTVTQDVEDYAKEVYNKLFEVGFRVESDFSNDALQEKIKNGEMEKVPYLFVIGKKEKEKKEVAVRKKNQGNLGNFSIDNIIEKLKKEVENKKWVMIQWGWSSIKGDSLRVNKAIKAKEVRVIDNDGKQLGVFPIDQALSLAEENNLDLVEINANINPPVCKIVDYGKYKYELTKKKKEAKKKQVTFDVKNLELRPFIGKGDLEYKVKNAKEWLLDGDKVKISIFFRGRELANKERGFELLKNVIDQLKDVAVVEKEPFFQGKRIECLIGPIKKGGNKDAQVKNLENSKEEI